jgi:isopentenyl phosphate kinase
MVGEVDGVYDRDPLANPGAVRIPRITPTSFARLEARLGSSHAVDVTGGMRTKVQAMVSLVAEGCVKRVDLISGRHRGALTQVLVDGGARGGTVIEGEREGQERNR